MSGKKMKKRSYRRKKRTDERLALFAVLGLCVAVVIGLVVVIGMEKKDGQTAAISLSEGTVQTTIAPVSDSALSQQAAGGEVSPAFAPVNPSVAGSLQTGTAVPLEATETDSALANAANLAQGISNDIARVHGFATADPNATEVPAVASVAGDGAYSMEEDTSAAAVMALREPDRVLEGVYPNVVEGFLPICYGKNTTDKVVALTFDDCNQPRNLQEILYRIWKEGGKATIFPIGENVSMLAGTLKDAVSQGFEIENHTMTHSGLYSEDDEGLAYQLCQQNNEVNKALGADYQMHFLRPKGGDNRYDQRTHAYLRQMGYYGIAYWSQVGSGNTADNLMANLKPGDIILFHTTDQDLATVRDLVPRLVAAGYRMVTLNELFGLEENQLSPLSTDAGTVALEAYTRFDQDLRKGDYLHDVYLMQEKLAQLGYLSADYNGYFGEKTVTALKQYQSDMGLPADGVCGKATWNRLFAV